MLSLNSFLAIIGLIGGHSKSTFAQDFQVLTPFPPCLPLFVFLSFQTRFTTLVHLINDHEVHIIYNQWTSSYFCWKCAKKIMDSAEKRTKSCAKLKGLAKVIVRHSLTGLNIIIFHDGLFNISYCHYNQ